MVSGQLLVRNIYIEEGVTHIGQNAFNGFTNATYAEIPSSVTSIGASAFQSVSKASFSDGTEEGKLDLSNVTSLGDHAFYACQSDH